VYSVSLSALEQCTVGILALALICYKQYSTNFRPVQLRNLIK
jgi:hypothetical protein